MNGLTKHTAAVFEQLSALQCVKEYTLIGGTALALHLKHRLSEDLDFCRWKDSRPVSVDWAMIKNELSTIGQVEANVLDHNQCDFMLNSVKLSFYANNNNKEPECLQKAPFLNNLKVADVTSIGVMKMEVMSRRATHRDYYDMYAILTSGVPLAAIVSGAGKYSFHNLHTKNMLSILTNTESIPVDPHFNRLNPVYDTDLKHIELAIGEHVKRFIMANRLQAKKSLSFALRNSLTEKNSLTERPEEANRSKRNGNLL